MPPAYHVLVVEDHDIMRRFLIRLLAQFYPEATIDTVKTGAEALSAIIQHSPDLIISGYEMPIMDGLDLVRTLRMQGENTPILLLSSDPSIAERALADGATAFLAKPFQVPAC
jgi:CheY-like chemotaxis protein